MKPLRTVVLDGGRIGGWDVQPAFAELVLQAAERGEVLSATLRHKPKHTLYYNDATKRFSLDAPGLTEPRPCPHIDAALNGRHECLSRFDPEDALLKSSAKGERSETYPEKGHPNSPYDPCAGTGSPACRPGDRRFAELLSRTRRRSGLD